MDIDKKDEIILNKVICLLSGHIKFVSETHGGYHVIVNRNKETGKIIHLHIKDMPCVEIMRDPMTVIPGTIQGGFDVIGILKDVLEKEK